SRRSRRHSSLAGSFAYCQLTLEIRTLGSCSASEGEIVAKILEIGILKNYPNGLQVEGLRIPQEQAIFHATDGIDGRGHDSRACKQPGTKMLRRAS
ncbi:MAG TPA: hypothetical protein VNM37_27950, partial [Candidatus Dormibacteraeota bacterium]|nr:hypothetical protein [Candidatus Dormibacteraeota bacterium]